ncbi:MAG: hypothetical protein A3G33_10120 [Omnitrophica bacterium RIFCSPLOWO2_12_FULL_44_17]|uniref:3-deoxy-manno-octulosonate cytidylyltransferase n=1 Tax=Candidatus Danuiimicrobium aquiferis TaxID=1801832 RepID=A0A1G1L235_9BACT|nr:MAG: hypothetical protein A3B72_08490 [Omnitrophica bacterium RIFCSPHIGHO2_02_FULL_45_28]OGW91291.1 MAG: hypothetical protein A3E74_10005 [Omnitrophica bacterium RIFCSPHIGHO2_12_FULL_44_12]OGW99178.1 MAG: hypothetical protein A3G33_10120 [Omnitrophica bacterium RIFCSPLOWO2_12_FULL_44_17]OGX04406.1 MAG: hypothetical protein A3J12_00490 [Omnitrophica bacterium RIFCSPLOWO2_02_FULL_44_11]
MHNSEVICVIPARLKSTRLAEKLLRKIGNKPLIQWVYENAKRAKTLSRVMIACDDILIKDCVTRFGGDAILTKVDHQSGTERIAEVAEKYECDIVVNVQGDEPMMHPSTIDSVVRALQVDPSCLMSTAYILKNDPAEFKNPNAVKLTKTKDGWALYFSRAPIPHDRDGKLGSYCKHLGIYGYRRDFLLKFPKLPSSQLEQREKLEQLKAIENGFKIKVVETAYDSIGVDTEEDFLQVEKILMQPNESRGIHA